MKTETVLLIAAAFGIGYIVHKKTSAAKTGSGPPPKSPSTGPNALLAGAAPQVPTQALPDENAEIIFAAPYPYPVEYVPYPVWGGSWGGSWGGRRHHHHGGHHRRR